MTDALLTTTLLALAGAAAGFAGQRLLRRLRRGTSVHTGWLAGGVALLWAVVGWRAGTGAVPGWWVPVPLALAWFAALLTATDLRHRRLPDALTLPAYPVVAAATVVAATTGGGWTVTTSALTGAVAYCVLHALVHLARPGSLGAGDVKLSGSVGGVLGAVGWPAMVLATALAASMTLLLRAASPHRWREGVPYGPGMLAAACLVALFPGTALVGP
jgi:leader peptidase (prepilin peptidase) / N-methyltransferase